MKDRTNQQLFERLLHEHQRLITKVAGIYARRLEDRRDLEQEICVQLWRSLPSYDERRAKASTWLYRVALNVAISYARRHPAQDEGRFEPLELRHLETIGGENTEEPDERLGALYAFIDQLEPLNRALILLYLEDRSYAEMADVLGISETNVATKIGRIKQTLRDRMVATAAEA